VDSEESFKMQKVDKASRSHRVKESASVFAIDPVMSTLKPNEWPDYVMRKGHPEGHV
jgi:hypothetical protein